MGSIRPYQHEPNYTEQEYQAIVAQRETLEREHFEQFDGRANNNNWCQCGKLCPPMSTDNESFCCHESVVIRKVKGNSVCITEHADFESVVLNIGTLSAARQNLTW